MTMKKESEMLQEKENCKVESVAVNLLSRFFKIVMPFPVYLAQLFPHIDDEDILGFFSPDPSGIDGGDLLSKLQSLQHSIVASHIDPIPCFADLKPRCSTDLDQDQEWQYEVMKELICRCQARILRNQGTSFSCNMLTLGYRKADDRSTVMKMVGSTGISNVHINTCVTRLLMGKEWHWLLKKIGEAAMEHILMHTALFVPLNAPAQSNLVQVLGHSIGEMKELQHCSKEVESIRRFPNDYQRRLCGKRKRRHTSSVNEGQQINKKIRNEDRTAMQRRPTEIDLLRNRIFYAKLSRTRTGGIVRGLPVNHVLQKTFSERMLLQHNPKAQSLSNSLDMGITPLESRIRLLSKHVWPREHGLKNVFTNEGTQSGIQKQYELRVALSSREEEIRIRGVIRTPERLINCKKLIKLMILKHDRFDYRRALDLCCPTSLPKRKLTKAERDDLVQELGETLMSDNLDSRTTKYNKIVETQIETQCDNFGMENENFSMDVEKTVRRVQKPEKPRYTKYKTPHGCVARFVRYVLRSIVPIELLGSHHNQKIIFRACDVLIGLRRYESINLHQIIQGFRMLDCEWILPRNKTARNQRPTKEENVKRQELINELLFWIFDGLVIPLLRTNFYATESAKFRNHTLFFRGDVWSNITEPIIENLKFERFEKIGKHKAVGIMSRRSFGYSFVRLLPKEVGMRPIVNLRRRNAKIDRITKSNVKSEIPKRTKRIARRTSNNATNEWGQLVVQNHSINTIMNATFQVFNFERQNDTNALGSSVFGPHDIFLRLSNFKSKLQNRYGHQLPQLYFVKMDVAGAFDCIDQKKLVKIVEGIIKHDRYIVQRYNKLTSSNGQPLRSWPKIACAEEEHEPFQSLAQHLAQMQAWRNTILADSVIYPHCDRKSLLWLLNEHINNNLIKVGKDFFRQRIGIPQGSTLSTLLCCYYLAKMESELRLNQSDDIDAGECLLMRYTDDFLFISSNQELARSFFVSIHQGSLDFNCSIAAEKTECNFRMFDASMEKTIANAALAVQVRSSVGVNGKEDSSFPWCSYRFDMQSLNVRYDFERYRNTCVADSLTIPNRKPFSTLLANMISQSVQRQNLPIYLDFSLNSREAILRNIHQMFLVATIKFIVAFQELKERHPVDQSKQVRAQGENFIQKSILTNIEHAYAHACAKMNQIRMQQIQQSGIGEAWRIPLMVYRWIALHSILSVLEMRSSTQKMRLTDSLKAEMRTVSVQIIKKTRTKKKFDIDSSSFFNIQYLKTQASSSFKRTKPILQSLKMQR